VYINISKENVSFIAQTLDKDQRDKHSAICDVIRPASSANSFPVFGDTILVILDTFNGKKRIFVSFHPISLAISELTRNELLKRAKKFFS